MRVGFVQLNSEMMRVEDNVDRAIRFLDRMKADLVVLPELFSTGYNFQTKRELEKVSEPIPGGYTTEKLLETSRKSDMVIVAGLAEKSDGSCYNSAVVVGDKYIGKYRKIHLFSKEKKLFKPGREFKVFGKIGVMICFDWIYPESARVLMLKGAEIIAHPAALVLPYCPESMKMRSLENRVFSVTADRVGGERGLRYIGSSQIVDSGGRVLHRASKTKEEFAVRTIQLKQAKNKKFSTYNSILKDREVNTYRILTKPVLR